MEAGGGRWRALVPRPLAPPGAARGRAEHKRGPARPKKGRRSFGSAVSWTLQQEQEQADSEGPVSPGTDRQLTSAPVCACSDRTPKSLHAVRAHPGLLPDLHAGGVLLPRHRLSAQAACRRKATHISSCSALDRPVHATPDLVLVHAASVLALAVSPGSRQVLKVSIRAGIIAYITPAAQQELSAYLRVEEGLSGFSLSGFLSTFAF